MEQDITFDFENDLQEENKDDRAPKRPILPTGEIGQQPKNFVKNFKKVCLVRLLTRVRLHMCLASMHSHTRVPCLLQRHSHLLKHVTSSGSSACDV